MDIEIEIIVATVSAAAAIVAAFLSASAQRAVQRLDQRFEGAKRSLAFRSDQLEKLYLPVSMHLRANRALATTHYRADEDTRTEIEHALHQHNKIIVECLLNSFMYLEPDAPESVSIELLEHLLQWETLYKLKYQSTPAFSDSIWAEIRRLGYTKFPEEAAKHFHQVASVVRAELHSELRGS